VHSEIQYQTDLFLSYFLNKDSTPSFEQTYHRQSAIVSPEGPTDDDPMGVVVHNPDCNLTFKNIPVGFYTADIGFYGNILTKYDPNGSSNIYDLFTITAMNEDELSDNNMEYDESRYILEHFILLKPGATVYIDIIEYEIGRYRLEIDSSVLVHVSIVNEYITSE